MSLLNELRARREEILSIAARNCIKDVRVFGSVVRGEERAGSDVDFLVTPEVQATLLDMAGFLAEMEALLKRRVDVVEDTTLHWVIRDQVLREAQRI